jgi:hypothetical protein
MLKLLFLHGDLEEDIYMDQPEGFVVPGKENLNCRLKNLFMASNNRLGNGIRDLTHLCSLMILSSLIMIAVSI